MGVNISALNKRTFIDEETYTYLHKKAKTKT